MAKPALSVRIRQDLRDGFFTRCRQDDLPPAVVLESLLQAWLEDRVSFRPAEVIAVQPLDFEEETHA